MKTRIIVELENLGAESRVTVRGEADEAMQGDDRVLLIATAALKSRITTAIKGFDPNKLTVGEVVSALKYTGTPEAGKENAE